MLDYHWVSSFSRLAPPAFSVAKRRCRHSAPRDMSITTIFELRLGLAAGILLCLMRDNLSLPNSLIFADETRLIRALYYLAQGGIKLC